MLEQVRTEYGHRLVIELLPPEWWKAGEDDAWPPPAAEPSIRDDAMRTLGQIELVTTEAIRERLPQDVRQRTRTKVEARTGYACTGCGTITEGPDLLPGGLLTRADWCCEDAWYVWVPTRLYPLIVALILPDRQRGPDVLRAGMSDGHDTPYNDWADELATLDAVGDIPDGAQWIVEKPGLGGGGLTAWQHDAGAWVQLDDTDATQRPSKIANVVGAQ